MSAPDLTVPIRSALLGDADVISALPAYLGSYPIFTRRPVPVDAPFPCIVISQDITLNEQDGIGDYRSEIQRDVAVYHTNELPANGEVIDAIAQAVRRTFHRRRNSLTVSGWSVVSVQASVPIDASSDSDQRVGVVVQLVVLVAALAA